MKVKNIIKTIIKIVIFLLIIISCYCCVAKRIGEYSLKYKTYTLDKEPSFITASLDDKLILVIDGEIRFIDSQMNETTIQLEINVGKVFCSYDWFWIIDDKNNLYALQVFKDNTYELSDVILENVICIAGYGRYKENAIAITTEGDVYVWGKGDEYCSVGIGGNIEIKEPMKIDNISNAKELVRFNHYMNTAILTENGELYVIGGIDNSEWSEEKHELIQHIDRVTEFKKVKIDSKISKIDGGGSLYTIYEDGTASRWSGINKNSDGDIILEMGYSDWENDIRFSQISCGGSSGIGMGTDKKLYLWGYDFIDKMSRKSDYTVYDTPQLIEFDKPVEDVYVASGVAFFKNGLVLYIVPDTSDW